MQRVLGCFLFCVVVVVAFHNDQAKDQQLGPGHAGPGRFAHLPQSTMLKVELTPTKQKYTAQDDVIVKVEISNPGPGAAKFLSFFLPSDSNKLSENLFEVSRDGHPVKHTGPRAFRPRVTSDDYTQLQAGQSVESSFNIGKYYDLSESGSYTITYTVAHWQFFHERGPPNKQLEALSSAPVVVDVDRAPVSPSSATSSLVQTGGGGSFSFDGTITNSQQNTLNNLFSSVVSMTNNAAKRVQKDDNLYKTYFGRYDESGAYVTSYKFQATTLMLQDDCSRVVLTNKCNDVSPKDTVAYVFAGDFPHRIHLCPQFWDNGYPNTNGSPSKASIIVHELSHFNNYQFCAGAPNYAQWGTDDYAYYEHVFDLLHGNQPEARENADTFRQYSENV
jgi:peptidyl-Lys metalloendopeptidase